MHILMQVIMPNEPFNSYARKGNVGDKLGRIMETIKPETAYFTNFDGKRGGIFVVEIDDASQVPSLAEPFFMTFDAEVQFRVCMTPDELGRAGLDKIAKTWS